jgi:hypothetical protein
MTGITYFVALPFDVSDGTVVVGDAIECPSPAAAIERAQGLWKVLGHSGAVATRQPRSIRCWTIWALRCPAWQRHEIASPPSLDDHEDLGAPTSTSADNNRGCLLALIPLNTIASILSVASTKPQTVPDSHMSAPLQAVSR